MNQTFAASPTRTPVKINNVRDMWRCRMVFEVFPRTEGGIEIQPEETLEVLYTIQQEELPKAYEMALRDINRVHAEDHIRVIVFEAELLPPVLVF